MKMMGSRTPGKVAADDDYGNADEPAPLYTSVYVDEVDNHSTDATGQK